ncbi:MAG TPA: N-acetyltransferase [Spirochaetota bacterium]|nr:N-acetyltransferase [Spirochaetota bacterium]
MNYRIRPAEEKDIDPIHGLIKHYAMQGVILERSREDILANLENFIVAEDSGTIIGTAAFYDYGETLKEVRSFAVDGHYHGMGIGSALLKRLIQNINGKSNTRIFTLTYKPEFFSKNGFIVVSKDDFPEKIWKDCRNCKDWDNCGETALVYRG